MNFADFGMDTASLAGTLERRLEVIAAAGFGQVMISAADVVAHPDGSAAGGHHFGASEDRRPGGGCSVEYRQRAAADPGIEILCTRVVGLTDQLGTAAQVVPILLLAGVIDLRAFGGRLPASQWPRTLVTCAIISGLAMAFSAEVVAFNVPMPSRALSSGP